MLRIPLEESLVGLHDQSDEAYLGIFGTL